MKKRVIVLLAALCLLVSGCAANTAASPVPESISVYRVLSPDYQTGGKLLQEDRVVPKTSGSPVAQAAAALAEKPQSEHLQCPLPDDVMILDAVRGENSVTVYLNTEYLKISGIEKTITDACITLTMCSISGIDFVSICVGSEVIEDKLDSEDFLLFDNIISSQKAQVRIYFPKSDENALGSEYHTISFDDENSPERGILYALLGGPTSDSLKRAFPLGTIVLSVYTQDGVCTVSLSGITPEDETHTPEEAKIAVYSIVNSLTSLSSIKSVQILIDGKQSPSLWGFGIYSPLSKNDSIVGSTVTQ